MVKRPKSPDIDEDVRYFTACQPFPLNANWIFPEDQKDCATWIAECIGLDHLYGLHYKPSARGMILLEVSKNFTQHERLLGEHRWSEMLEDPTEEEKNRVSRVFHSFYSKGRDAQKDGWKSLVINASWFRDWSPGTGRFKQPYPQTHWCPVPVEDQTNKSLCRPLPVDRMPPPPRIEKPVVGSTKWIQKKNLGQPTEDALKMSYDEDISSVEAINKINERAQAKLNSGPSSAPVLSERNSTSTSPSTDTFYPPLGAIEIITSAPKKTQATTSNLVPLGKNKKKAKPTPLGQFIGGEGGKKSTPTTWNKVTPPIASAPAVLNGPLPKPSPPANAWAKPINLKVVAPVVAVKKEIPPEDYSSWGEEPASSTIEQENIWKSPPPPTPQSSKKGKGRAETPSATSTSQGSSTPKALNTPTSAVSSPFTRDLPPHQLFPEDESDDEDTYVPFPNMTLTFPEEMEYTNVNTWERGDDANALDPGIPDPVEEGRKYQNLWSSEDDPRAVPAPAIICPVHYLGCKKGICEVLSRKIKEMKREELKATWEEEKLKKSKGKKKKVASGGDDENNNEVEADQDNFVKVTRPKGKKVQDEPSYTGRMRAFPDDPVASDDEPYANDEASGSGPKDNSAPEGQLFNQW